ncbi:Ell-associated factor Eaf [Caenorhabditis elegans]|uniref:Ell-associated factor Eaf n=1 Tax=Caenorhabditis elegans TaxID=6239 RepID=Q9TXQ9_CAEEL|nr:Ell-associated factor Eaf [Caenorhabditis elegans]CCD67330.1 Ell-associated factor Eaf [Caenorhabditis elegans]|eukprot:NP_491404.2 ELL Associated Factor homolog [Caenorhabditis elegans]
MAESSDIPNGTYTLTLGKSFEVKGRKSDPKAEQFHTLRYDFKPSSVSNNADTFIAFGNSGDVHVSVPSEGDNMTVYKGSKKEAKPKECLLFFDKKTNTVRLEKITSNINVKKTRDLDQGTELALKRGIERLRTSSNNQRSGPSSPEEKAKIQKQMQRDTSDSSSDSDGSSDSDKSNGDSSDDEDESEKILLEEMKKPKPYTEREPAPPSSSNTYNHKESHVAPYISSSGNKNKDSEEKYGLALSESSDEDD